MSVIELSKPLMPAGMQRQLSGWGRTGGGRSRVFEPRSAEEVGAMLAAERSAGARLIARGAGCSYGDAAQSDGGDVLDMRALQGIGALDVERLLISAQAGVTIAQLMAHLGPRGLGLPVVPGTRHVTVAGAIASDIHGKNHHRDGALARHVASITLCTATGSVVEVSPQSDAELFFATLGGMGLTGIILEASLRVEPLSSPWVSVDIDRTRGLSETLELLAAPERHRYSVAWLDLLAGGSRMGRAVLARADPWIGAAPEVSLVRRRRLAAAANPASLIAGPVARVPAGVPGLLRPANVRAFNALRWAISPRRERGRAEALAPFFFPLDVLGAWNRLYGPDGLIQYQLVIPSGEEAALEAVFSLIGRRRLPVYLAVFKRFGAAYGGPLSFPLEGWTLALDIPAAAPGLHAALGELDALVAGCGGRVYLTKDARLGRDALEAMYPELESFRAVCERVDPEGLLGSDLSRRLGISAERTR